MKLLLILLVTTFGATTASPQKPEPIDEAAEVKALAKRFREPENLMTTFAIMPPPH